MDANLLNAVNNARASRQAVAVITELASGRQRLVRREQVTSDTDAQELGARFASGKSGIVADKGGERFIQVYLPSPRLVIIGAVHISQTLAPMAQACDFDVTVIDPRTAFATSDRFSNVDLIARWPQEVLEERPLDPYTALAAVTHDPKIDDVPLAEALKAGCFYVGALGSRKTHAKRVERLKELGLSGEQIAGIRAPIGIDIGAANPSEIAVAVLAEIITNLRHRGESSSRAAA